jgi:hypothetical protein
MDVRPQEDSKEGEQGKKSTKCKASGRKQGGREQGGR